MSSFVLLGVNSFNPALCDGVSNSILELMAFLKNKGHQVKIINYLTGEPYRQFIYKQFNKNSTNWQDVGYQLTVSGLEVVMRLLPDREKASQSQAVKLIMREIKDLQIDFVLTIDNCFSALLVAHLLNIPGAHWFHSEAYVKEFRNKPYYLMMLKNRQVLATSQYIQARIKACLDLNSIVWYPIIDFNRCQTTTQTTTANNLGFYSGGPHKGDELVNYLIGQMPEYNFITAGRLFQSIFKTAPKNLEILGDVADIKTFYQKIKLLLVPSLVPEGFGRVIVEAAANGIPTIANNVGGIPEALGQSGLLVDVENIKQPNMPLLVNRYQSIIEQLCNNKTDYDLCQQQALAQAKKYKFLQEQMNNENYRLITGKK
ncbi:glycosyltransferase [Candidatus Saganbacteria bacterium]|nr:glycosyltransferase [Candidatus Saganbacteria bacterium]